MKKYKVVYNKEGNKFISFTVVENGLNTKNQLIKGYNRNVIELDKSRGFSENISFKHRQTGCQLWHSSIRSIFKKSEIRALP